MNIVHGHCTIANLKQVCKPAAVSSARTACQTRRYLPKHRPFQFLDGNQSRLVVRCQSTAPSVDVTVAPGPQRPTPSDPWGKCFEMLENATVVEPVVTGFNKGGVIVELEGLRGFVPYHQLDPSRLVQGHQGDFSFLIGQKLSARVLLVDVQGARKSLILSERQMLIGEVMAKLQVGQVVAGTVTRLEDYGAFVKLDDYPPVLGLVQLEEISWNKVLTADSLLRRGQQVQAVVTEINTAKCRLALSIKRLTTDPLKQTVGSSEVEWQPSRTPLPQVAGFMDALRQQEGISAVALIRQAQDRASVSQELEVWLTKEEVEDGFNVVVREGGTQQQLHLSTSLPRQQVITLLQTVLRSSNQAAAPSAAAAPTSPPSPPTP